MPSNLLQISADHTVVLEDLTQVNLVQLGYTSVAIALYLGSKVLI
jgi:hypothetical protein